MNYLLLPDFFAITLLVGVLMTVRRSRRGSPITLWTAGLLLILLECAARIVYGMHTAYTVHLAMHVIALDAYGAAGALFLLSASRALRRMPHSNLFLWANVAPHLMLFTVYGLNVKTAWVYHSLVALGVVVGGISCVLLRLGWQYCAGLAVVWIPLIITTRIQDFRTAIYLSLFFLYLLPAIFFYGSLRKNSRGKIAVVAGFTMWALCFATHPWIATTHPQWVEFASQVWNMQKFVITVGLLLVMLEDQIRSNEWLALHDELTGLANRRLLDERLRQLIGLAERNGRGVALFQLDLDGFKQVNDTYGHDAGDLLLRELSRRLRLAVRRDDVLARQGGDEFSLVAGDIEDVPIPEPDGPHLLTGHRAMHLLPIRELFVAMLNAVEQPVNLGEKYNGATVRVSVSIGVAMFPDDAATADELMRVADAAMYRHKAERKRTSRSNPVEPLPLPSERKLQTA